MSTKQTDGYTELSPSTLSGNHFYDGGGSGSSGMSWMLIVGFLLSLALIETYMYPTATQKLVATSEPIETKYENPIFSTPFDR